MYKPNDIVMNINAILISSFIVLIGLQMCAPEKNNKFAMRANEMLWTNSFVLRSLHGLCTIVGTLVVLGFTIYLTFTEEWWYILVYIGGFILAKLIALLVKTLLSSFQKNTSSEIKIQRMAGCALIIVGLLCFIII